MGQFYFGDRRLKWLNLQPALTAGSYACNAIKFDAAFSPVTIAIRRRSHFFSAARFCAS